MASENPPAPRQAHEPSDQSIKARKHQLFEEPQPDDGLATRRFSDYLRDTPPAPLAPRVKAVLWAVGAVVALLFLVALLSGRTPRVVKSRQAAAPPPPAPRPLSLAALPPET